MATHCSILAWRTPWTEEHGRLRSIGSQRVRHDWSDLGVADKCIKETFYMKGLQWETMQSVAYQQFVLILHPWYLDSRSGNVFSSQLFIICLPLCFPSLLLLLLSHFSRVRLCATPETAAHQAPPIPGILQARILEWVAISFSNAWKWKVKVKSLSRVWLLATPWTAAYQAPLSMGFSRQEYWSGVLLPSPIIYALYWKT